MALLDPDPPSVSAQSGPWLEWATPAASRAEWDGETVIRFYECDAPTVPAFRQAVYWIERIIIRGGSVSWARCCYTF